MCFVSVAYNNVEIRASGNEDKDSKNGCHFHRSRVASARKKYAYKSKHGNSEIYFKEPIRNKRETTKLILFLKKKMSRENIISRPAVFTFIHERFLWPISLFPGRAVDCNSKLTRDIS